MSKKPKINKRLDNLFKGLAPEESSAKPKPSQLDAQENAPSLPAELASAPKHLKEEEPSQPAPAPKHRKEDSHPVAVKPVKKHTTMLVAPPTPVIVQEDATTTYAVNIHTGYQDWATLRVLDETGQRQWTTDEELLVKQVSDQLSLALENARLFQEAQERAEELALINNIVSSLNEATNLQDALQAVISEIVQALPVARGAIAMVDEERKNFNVIADHSKIGEASSIGLKIPMEGNTATNTIVTTKNLFFWKTPQTTPPTRLPCRRNSEGWVFRILPFFQLL